MLSVGDTTTIATIVGIFIGIVARTVLRYLEKLRAAEQTGEQMKFDQKFLVTAIIGFVMALAPTITLFPTIVEKIGPLGGLALPAVVITSAMAAYGTNEAINYGVKVTENSVKASYNRLQSKQQKES